MEIRPPSAVPVLPSAAGSDARLDGVATDFEALFLSQILHAAHAAALAEDPMEGDGTQQFRAMQDDMLARQLAQSAPLGVATQLRQVPR